MTPADDSLVQLTAHVVRGLAMDAVQQANSGHPGMPMGMAEVAAVLWTRHLRYVPDAPDWPGRDRFVLSAGHGSMLLYSMLHLAGYPLSLDDLRAFRQLGSRTPGHPEHHDTPGVETTTGPLGQGFANGVGMALAARMEAARFENPDFENRVVGIVSDGDLMEGLSNEAASLAGHLELANLVYLYDDNRITIEGKTDLAFREDVRMRFAALGWRVFACDGHDLLQVHDVLGQAFQPSAQPTLVICRTHIAQGSPNKVDTHDAHGAPLGKDEVAATKRALGLPDEPFWVPDDVREMFAAVREINTRRKQAWDTRVATWRKQQPELAREHDRFATRATPNDLLTQLIAAAPGAGATRALSGKIIQRAAALVPSLAGGSADLDPSTKTRILDSTSVQARDYAGRNLHFGVREHAMGAILNGMALHGGFLPIGSTFLVFADYMRPPIRLAALMRQRVGFVFTHDSLMVGEDGPTHQPIEQIASLRLIPNLHLFRPADGAETAAAWTHLLTRADGPTALALTRQDLPALSRPSTFQPDHLLRGGYPIRDTAGARATLIATGSEVATALAAADLLQQRNLPIRVVSMPCVELFLTQDEAWRNHCLPKSLPVLALEMGRPEGWCVFTGSLQHVLGVSTFGQSAPYKQLAEQYGFTPAQVADRIASILA